MITQIDSALQDLEWQKTPIILFIPNFEDSYSLKTIVHLTMNEKRKIHVLFLDDLYQLIHLGRIDNRGNEYLKRKVA